MAKKEFDFVIMHRDFLICPIEIKTKATLSAGDHLRYAKFLSTEHERLKNHSLPFGQIYHQYMVMQGAKYGVLSNYNQTIFLRVVDEGGKLVLEISDPVDYDSTSPYVHQSFLYLLSLIVKERQMTTNLDCLGNERRKSSEFQCRSTLPYHEY